MHMYIEIVQAYSYSGQALGLNMHNLMSYNNLEILYESCAHEYVNIHSIEEPPPVQGSAQHILVMSQIFNIVQIIDLYLIWQIV